MLYLRGQGINRSLNAGNTVYPYILAVIDAARRNSGGLGWSGDVTDAYHAIPVARRSRIWLGLCVLKYCRSPARGAITQSAAARAQKARDVRLPVQYCRCLLATPPGSGREEISRRCELIQNQSV